MLNPKKRFILAIIVGCTLILGGIFFAKDKSTKTPYSPKTIPVADVSKALEENSASLDESVYRVPQNPHKRGLNFIFFADGYLSWDDFEKDINFIMRGMQSVEPWRSFNRFNVYKIRPKELDLCGVKVKDERKPVIRCSPDGLNSYLNKLVLGNQFKLILLSRRDFQSWANVVRIADSGIFMSIPQSPQEINGEQALGIQFLHLLGHAFGLKDEELFIIAKFDAAVLVPDGPNCAPNKRTAQKWWSHLAEKYPNRVGYFGGCSGKKEYMKPTEGSLMNLGDLSKFEPDYGPVSEEYLNKILKFCFSEAVYKESDDSKFFMTYPEFKACVN